MDPIKVLSRIIRSGGASAEQLVPRILNTFHRGGERAPSWGSLWRAGTTSDDALLANLYGRLGREAQPHTKVLLHTLEDRLTNRAPPVLFNDPVVSRFRHGEPIPNLAASPNEVSRLLDILEDDIHHSPGVAISSPGEGSLSPGESLDLLFTTSHELDHGKRLAERMKLARKAEVHPDRLGSVLPGKLGRGANASAFGKQEYEALADIAAWLDIKKLGIPPSELATIMSDPGFSPVLYSKEMSYKMRPIITELMLQRMGIDPRTVRLAGDIPAADSWESARELRSEARRTRRTMGDLVARLVDPSRFRLS